MSAASRLAFPLAGLAFLAACDSASENKAATANLASAEGTAEEGKITLKGPGVDMSFVVPKGMRGEAKADKNSNFLYPGATIGGIAIVGIQANGGKADKNGGGDTEAEFRFATADPPAKVAAWYRDPARGKDLHVTAANKDGDDMVISGVEPGDNHPFKVRLKARPGGGTDGRLTIHHED
ncbi:MAG TPA: hypothetical protein VKI45_02830 [Allosphingosinicella sp.]|nr:hypothetical protein [Allosphingosinicella sp.]